MSFDNLRGYILSIYQCICKKKNNKKKKKKKKKKKIITIFHSVQEIGPFSLFQNLELGKNFHFFRIWRLSKPRPMINVNLQFLELDLVNINVSAKFYQNIPNGLRVKFHCFQNLNVGETSTNPKCHLTIS